MKRSFLLFAGVAIGSAILAVAALALLTSIFERKQEAKNPYVRLVEVSEETTDAAPWGTNWSREYDAYLRTADSTRTRFGGSESLPKEKIERDPWLVRMFAGYAFSIDYRDRRGHAYMLSDQEMTKRVTERPQPGSCLHCHASVIPTYRRVGDGDVFRGFEALGKMKYADAHAEVVKTGTMNPVAGGTKIEFRHADGVFPLGCVDCHDPKSMELRVTRLRRRRELDGLPRPRGDGPDPRGIDRLLEAGSDRREDFALGSEYEARSVDLLKELAGKGFFTTPGATDEAFREAVGAP